MEGAAKSWSFSAWLRDRAYDVVFHVGDTALQFTADMIRGPENSRHDSYAARQLQRQERKPMSALKAATAKKPLSFSEGQIFSEMLRRRNNESIIEHWKRRKDWLQHPHKRQLIAVEQKIEREATSRQQAITVEHRSLARQYQRERVRQKPKRRTRSR